MLLGQAAKGGVEGDEASLFASKSFILVSMLWKESSWIPPAQWATKERMARHETWPTWKDPQDIPRLQNPQKQRYKWFDDCIDVLKLSCDILALVNQRPPLHAEVVAFSGVVDLPEFDGWPATKIIFMIDWESCAGGSGLIPRCFRLFISLWSLLSLDAAITRITVWHKNYKCFDTVVSYYITLWTRLLRRVFTILVVLSDYPRLLCAKISPPSLPHSMKKFGLEYLPKPNYWQN